MKVAATYEDGQVFQHFGRTQQFKVYDVEDGRVLGGEVVSAGGAGHEALATFLHDQGVEAVVCGGLGGGMMSALTRLGIAVYPGNTGSTDEAVAAFAAGRLAQASAATCADRHHAGGGAPAAGASGAGGFGVPFVQPGASR